MATVEITADNIDQITADNEIVAIDFWAAWCGPCRMFSPIFEDASERHTDIVFGKVDTDAHPQLAQDFDVRSIPTLVVLRDNIVVHYSAGVMTPQQLDAILDEVRNLDMEEVARQAN